MLPRADLNSARPVAYVEAPTPASGATDARQELYHRLAQIAAGQKLQATILQRFDDGTFLVRIAGGNAQMSLPVGSKVGDNLTMTLLEHSPRPAFAIDLEPAPQTGDARATLSQGGRLIDRLLQSAQQGGASTAIVGRVPVLPSPEAGTTQFAAALQNAVDSSGLFYESHLAQWAQGSRSLASLMSEPQAQMGGIPRPAVGTDSVLLRHLMQQWTAGGRPLTDLVRELQTRSGNLIKPDVAALTQPQAAAAYLNDLMKQWADTGRSVMDLMTPAVRASVDDMAQQINPQATQLINAQLHTLEHQSFIWQGQLWPGQRMEWEVSRDAPESNGNAEGGGQQSWRSTMRFELPELGTISATIHLQGERVNVLVKAENENVATTLRAHGGDLASALKAAGSSLDSLTVSGDGKA